MCMCVYEYRCRVHIVFKCTTTDIFELLDHTRFAFGLVGYEIFAVMSILPKIYEPLEKW